ncbi:hypothetical protein HNR42_001313 [Deinobacterium chartae]|uniref:Uncharacterized protein n=1 Tax=Deinobacterium chartae TaxID=521158 RepID=A0A841I0C0_9DEIO|nr:hypothetical protein [Deinobacterium chartae]MBB6097890.1 hypothetical protein [Deinobacterium chartae]
MPVSTHTTALRLWRLASLGLSLDDLAGALAASGTPHPHHLPWSETTVRALLLEAFGRLPLTGETDPPQHLRDCLQRGIVLTREGLAQLLLEGVGPQAAALALQLPACTRARLEPEDNSERGRLILEATEAFAGLQLTCAYGQASTALQRLGLGCD